MPPNPITLALERVERGDENAHEALWELVYAELKRMAAARMAALKPGQTLQPTALVHEAWVRLGAGEGRWQGRTHFFGAAARSMRNILVDDARRRGRLRRNPGHEVQALPSELLDATGRDELDMLALDEALNELQAEYDRPAQVVMLRFFAGLELEEIAEALEVTRRTVDRDWLFARTWLHRFLNS